MAYRLDALQPFLDLPEPFKPKTCPYCNGSRDATVKYPENKPPPFEFYEKNLKGAKTIVAPMVDQSELPFRMMCRKYGAELAYTPMFNSKQFSESAEYRRQQFSTCPEDRPLFVQFCGHDADTVLAAARFVEDHCDAVDINLGCPQGIAKKGHYGAYLMECWDTVHTIIHTLRVELKVPVTAKMRLFDDVDGLTMRYARMLRDAGAHVICVHGRTREMKGQHTGIADMDAVRRVREHITDRPVFANGNILRYSDVPANLALTKCPAVMSAEALLWDPRVFANPEHPILNGRMFHVNKGMRKVAVAVAREYFECFVAKYPTEFPFVKTHLFKLLFHPFEKHTAFRNRMGDIDDKKKDGAAQIAALLAGIAAAVDGEPQEDATRKAAAASTRTANDNDEFDETPDDGESPMTWARSHEVSATTGETRSAEAAESCDVAKVAEEEARRRSGNNQTAVKEADAEEMDVTMPDWLGQ